MRLFINIRSLAVAVLFVAIFSGFAAPIEAQNCFRGRCLIPPAPPLVEPLPFELADPVEIVLQPLEEDCDLTSAEVIEAASTDDRLDQVIRATVRVTVGNTCGSGTIVGRASDGSAIVLTNAHVAGTRRGRIINLVRWDQDGNSESGTGSIIAAGYGAGTSVDFALVKCRDGFAEDVTPIPLAERYPEQECRVTNFGSPRCEWPSLQVLRLTRDEGQILTWKPNAISGRSGSSIIDYTEAGPRVVGLLTWSNGSEGMGQSTPFLLSAIRGRLPKSLEPMPLGAYEVVATASAEDDIVDLISEPEIKPTPDPLPNQEGPDSVPPDESEPQQLPLPTEPPTSRSEWVWLIVVSVITLLNSLGVIKVNLPTKVNTRKR